MQPLTPSPTHRFADAINSGCLRAIEHIAATGVPTEILRDVAAEHCADEWKANMAVRDAGETLREGLAELPAWLHSHCTVQRRRHFYPGSPQAGSLPEEKRGDPRCLGHPLRACRGLRPRRVRPPLARSR